MENVEVNLTRLMNKFYKISKTINYELKLIENYSYHVTTDMNTINRTIKDMLLDSYGSDEFPEVEISTFYSLGRTYNTMEKFIEILEFLLLNKINPYFENITFDKIVSSTKDELIVSFMVE